MHRRSKTARPGRASGIVRPRMLIGAHDPLTGFAILRARYAAGARPPDRLEGWALTWLLTGDTRFARRAVSALRRTRPPEKAGYPVYHEYVHRSLAFDWLHDYRGFDAALEDRIARELLDAAEQVLRGSQLRGDPEQVSYHNYPARDLALALFALTAIEGHPSVERRAAPLRERARAIFDHLLDMSQLLTPDGGYHESMDYQRIVYAPMAMMAELLRTTANVDPALRYTIFHHYTDTYLYKCLPDGTTSRDDDNEEPYLKEEDNVVLGYAVHRFKDPHAAWILRRSGWPTTEEWLFPVTRLLWDDPDVTPRDPALAPEAELSRHYLFRGIGHLVMRDGWGPDSTWIEFDCGPYLGKHDHLDQNHFVIYHRGYLATQSGADYEENETAHFLNYYRRTVAVNSMLVYQPGERFFWSDNLWYAANDGGQRMDSSRYWNTVRSREDFDRTRDLWDTGRMEATEHVPGVYHYARGDATRAYQPSKMELFTRDLVYTPDTNVLVVFDRVRSTDPGYKKAWLLHGVAEPSIVAGEHAHDVGHGGMAYRNASTFTYEDRKGRLRVHSLLPREREVTKRGGPGWEFWTPGDEFGGAWGSGRNWPMVPFEGGPLPDDEYLRRMWKTFHGPNAEMILPSNARAVVPAAWRVEVSPVIPAKEDLFLHVLEIGDRGDSRTPRIELLDGFNVVGAIVEGGAVTLFPTATGFFAEAEVTIPAIASTTLIVAGLVPHARYELQVTGGRDDWRGAVSGARPPGDDTARASESGVLHVPFEGKTEGRLRLRRVGGSGSESR